jgi:thioredoxin-like negative regulator of GroEL
MNTFNDRKEHEEHVRQHRKALVLFCASWCPFCQEFFPIFDRLVRKQDFGKVFRVYVDDYDDPLWDEFAIEAVPTVVLFEHGKATH